MDAKTRFLQSDYFLRKNIRMNNIKPWSPKIAISGYRQVIHAGDESTLTRMYRAKRGGFVGTGPTPARACRRLREKEGVGR